MVVTSKGIVLAGHRRMRACKKLGIDEVDVEIKDFDTPEQEIEFIIDNNATREKTKEQKAREANALKESLTELAKKRKLSNLKHYQSSDMPQMAQQNNSSIEVPNSALRENDIEMGKVRDIVAPKTGLKSGQEVDRAIKVIRKIDELEEEGRAEDADILRGVMNNRSVSAAENLAKNIECIKDIPEEDKIDIKSGRKSPNSYIKNHDNSQKVNGEAKVYAEVEDMRKAESKNEESKKAHDDFLIDIQNAVNQSSKIMVGCLENLADKQYIRSNKREITNRIQSKIRSYIETINSIQELIASMEKKVMPI